MSAAPMPVPSVVLLAVCDVLVGKTMEALGRWIVRGERSRRGALGATPYTEAHCRWTPTDEMVDQALSHAWDVVPALLDPYAPAGLQTDQIVRMLDDYVHDLAITGTVHTTDELAYRLRTRLDLPENELPTPQPHPTPHSHHHHSHLSEDSWLAV